MEVETQQFSNSIKMTTKNGGSMMQEMVMFILEAIVQVKSLIQITKEMFILLIRMEVLFNTGSFKVWNIMNSTSKTEQLTGICPKQL